MGRPASNDNSNEHMIHTIMKYSNSIGLGSGEEKSFLWEREYTFKRVVALGKKRRISDREAILRKSRVDL